MQYRDAFAIGNRAYRQKENLRAIAGTAARITKYDNRQTRPNGQPFIGDNRLFRRLHDNGGQLFMVSYQNKFTYGIRPVGVLADNSPYELRFNICEASSTIATSNRFRLKSSIFPDKEDKVATNTRQECIERFASSLFRHCFMRSDSK